MKKVKRGMSENKEGKMSKGWKSYIVAALGVLFNGLVASGYIDESLRPTINSILAFLGLAAIRNAVK